MFDDFISGMHKHFRIIAIHNYMIGQGVVSSDDEHTTIPGLWTKLRSLYNLPILDEREDSIMHSSSDENGSAGGRYCPYELPDNEYAAMKFDKRINLNGSKSPALLPSRGESTIADTDEPRSSPVPGARGGRATRRGGRISKLQQEAGGSRRASKAASVADDQPMEDSGEQEGDDEEGSDGDVAAESPKPKGTARSTAKGRGTLKNKGVRVRSSTRSRARRK